MKLQTWKAALLIVLCSIFSEQLFAQQLKLGAAPTVIDKNALLELNSDKQGLLLPRIAKSQILSGGALYNAQNGMFVFITDESSLYLKKNNTWQKVADYSMVAGTGINIDPLTNTIKNTGVTSFKTRTGDVIPQAGDYNLGQMGDVSFAIPPANNDVLTFNGTNWVPKATAPAGVTAVGLSMPSLFTVTGSPVTTAGTLTATLNDVNPNTILAGPAAGTTPGTPVFRSLVAADIPNNLSSYIQNTTTAQAGANFNIAGNGTIGGTFTLKGLAGVTPEAPTNAVLSINNAGDVIVTQNVSLDNWLISGNVGAPAGSFLGNKDDVPMVIKSNNVPYLQFGSRSKLNLIDSKPDYTDGTQKVTLLGSALQFEAPGASFYQPMFFVDPNGNFRMKGSMAGTDLFEFGATGTNNNGAFDFIVGDDGDEPIIFKSYNYLGATTEIMRLQSGKVGIGLTNMPARSLHVAGDMRLTGSAGTPTAILGRDNNGDINNLGINANTLAITAGVLGANNTSAVWNAGQIQGKDISATAPTDGQVLKWNNTSSTYVPADDITGGASYGDLTNNDIRYANAPDPKYRMKIWASPVNGVVMNGPLGTTANAWSVLSFQMPGFTTQLYFDKNTLALKEWAGFNTPLQNNTGNGWYKVVTTNGNNTFTDGGVIFAQKTSDASSETTQDPTNLFWDNGGKRLGLKINNPAATLDVNGTTKLGTNGTPITGMLTGTGSITIPRGTYYQTATSEYTFSFPNASTNSVVMLSPTNSFISISSELASVGIAYAYVSATGTIRVGLTSGTIVTSAARTINFNVVVINK
ncbi:hypothetical protein ACDQ55_12755 [Chitinophaga sp. 30R24]|uniref:hypothetical protein n=1 Tax=Chitinophaga sp. 30R24 TaxID=3248838 RepID=UPI003B907736